MTLATNVATGHPNHAGLHNEERNSINALSAQFAATFGSTSVLMPDASASVNVTNIRNLIEAARFGDNGATIQLGPGTFNLNDMIEFHNLYGLRFVGVGGATILRWIGNDASKPVLKLSHCQRCYFADLQINIANAAYAGIQQLRDNVEPRTVTPMRNHYERVDVFCNNFAATGIYVGGVGLINANNDFAVFDNVRVQDYTSEGWFLDGSQSYGNQMRSCYARSDNGQAKYAVFAPTQCGHFNWYGGFVGGNRVADFHIGRSTQPYVIEGVNSEGSARLLEVPAGFYRQITLRGIRWAGNGLHADKKAIIQAGYTHLLIEHCMIGYGSNNAPVTLEFINSNDGIAGSLVMIGNRIYSTAVNVFTGLVPGMLYGNSKITDEANLTTVALTQ